MTRLARLSVLGLLLAGVGCHTCGDRPVLFPRLREALDRDDDDRLRDRVRRTHDADADRLAATRPAVAAVQPGCVPCGGVGGVPTGSTLGYGGGVVSGPVVYGGTYGTPSLGAPVMTGGSGGMPVYPGGSGVVIPGGTYTPRDNELPLPGGYSQPRAEDMGRLAPRPSNGVMTGGR